MVDLKEGMKHMVKEIAEGESFVSVAAITNVNRMKTMRTRIYLCKEHAPTSMKRCG
jgi:hypothetical protein